MRIYNTLAVKILSNIPSLSAHLHQCVTQTANFVLAQYVRVMPAGGQCYEPGPFFATIPRHVTRVGINRRRDLLLRPDWLVTGGLLFGSVVILCLCVTLLVSVQYIHKHILSH